MSMRDLQGEELKLRQGRWFQLDDERKGSPGAPGSPSTAVAHDGNGAGTAELAALAQQGGARFDPFLAVVSGQVALAPRQAAPPAVALPEPWEGLEGLSRRDQAVAALAKQFCGFGKIGRID